MRWAALMLVLTVVTVAAAQEGPQPAPLTGPYQLEDTLVVGPGETLRLGPGVNFTGSGRIVAWGHLEARGSEGAWVELGVPVDVRGNGSAQFVKTRFWGAAHAALEVDGGSVELEEVRFAANAVGLTVGGGGHVTARDVGFLQHGATALRVSGPASLRLDEAFFDENLLAFQVDAGAGIVDVRLGEARFEGNDRHALIDLGTSREAFVVDVAASAFGPLAEPGSGVRVRSGLLEPPQEAAPADRLVRFESTTFEGMQTALDVSGSGFQTHLVRAAFLANGEGIRAYRTDVLLENVTFEANDVELTQDAASRMTLVDVLHQPSVTDAAILPAPRTGGSWWPALLVVGATAMLTGGFVLSRRQARQAEDVAQAVHVAPAAPEAIDVDPLSDFSETERAVLLEVHAHPGSSQRAVADRLGLTRQALHYHVKKLVVRGAIEKVAAGRETHCHVSPPLAERISRRLERGGR